MTQFLIGLLIGAVFGAAGGVFIMALCVKGDDRDD